MERDFVCRWPLGTATQRGRWVGYQHKAPLGRYEVPLPYSIYLVQRARWPAPCPNNNSVLLMARHLTYSLLQAGGAYLRGCRCLPPQPLVDSSTVSKTWEALVFQASLHAWERLLVQIKIVASSRLRRALPCIMQCVRRSCHPRRTAHRLDLPRGHPRTRPGQRRLARPFEGTVRPI